MRKYKHLLKIISVMLLAIVFMLGYALGDSSGTFSSQDADKNAEEFNDTYSSWPESLKIWTYRNAVGSRDVRIDSGVIRGQLQNEADGEYFSFLGIPYAASPTGRNRFMPPFPPKPWLNMFLANRTVKCPQNGFGDENCLVLNVFTPVALTTQLPVVVYIHGGSFIMGSAPTSGLTLLTKQNLIVVTINYRLGVLGFLCLGIGDAVGNVGLKDQTAALQWVQRNIQQFGGDPSQVTLYGMSAGAASVEFHVLSGISDGLFHRAIIESGSATSVWATDSEPIDTAKHFASLLKPKSSIRNLEDLVRFLQSVPVGKLSIVNNQYYQSLTDGTFGFVPCVENKYSALDAFITDPPTDILETRNYTHVPVMFIFSSLEGLFLRSSEYYELDYRRRMNENLMAFMPADLNIDRVPVKQPVVKKVQREYFGPNGIVDDKNLIGYLNFFGDSLIMHNLLKSVEMHADPEVPVYLMEFAYKGDRGAFEEFYQHINMAGHGDFSRTVMSTIPAKSRSDKLVYNRAATLLGNFAKFGEPTPSQTSLLPEIWPAVQPNNLTYLVVAQECSVRSGFNSSRFHLWDELYNMYKKPVKPVNPFIFM